MYQIGALQAFCLANGVSLAHVNPHGAMYNMAGKDEKMAMAICEGIYAVNPKLILLGLAGSKLLTAAKKRDSELRRRFLRIELMKRTVR